MKVIYTPQVPLTPVECDYSADGDVLTVVMDGVVETFDFTDLPDGEAENIDCGELSTNPILNAKRSEGVLTVTLSRFIKPRPRRKMFPMEDEAGDEYFVEEDNESLEARMDAWEASKKLSFETL